MTNREESINAQLSQVTDFVFSLTPGDVQPEARSAPRGGPRARAAPFDGLPQVPDPAVVVRQLLVLTDLPQRKEAVPLVDAALPRLDDMTARL